MSDPWWVREVSGYLAIAMIIVVNAAMKLKLGWTVCILIDPVIPHGFVEGLYLDFSLYQVE
jgi:hypothetical protein